MRKLVYFLLVFLTVLQYIRGRMKEEPYVDLVPDGQAFLLEGQKAVFVCNGTDQFHAEFPDVQFRDTDDIPYVNATGITIVSTRDAAIFSTIVTLTFDAIKASDIRTSTTICKAIVKSRGESLAHQVTIYIIPKKSIPKIKSNLEPEITVKKGSEVTMVCNATAQLGGSVTGLSIRWNFKNFSNNKTSTLPLNAQTSDITESSNKTFKVSRLILSSVKLNNTGKYYCSAILEFNNGGKLPADKYFETVEIKKVIFEETAENTKEEVESKKGDSLVQFDCQVLGSPPANITWKKDDESINANSSSRYTLSLQSIDDPANRYLTITDISFGDRGVYKCFARRTDITITKEFTLRVRDPLGALWPFIGIVAEAIVLAIIIGSCELYKRNKKSGKTDEYDGSTQPDAGEKSPLVTDAPKVSYSADNDGVRIRNANTDA